MSREEVKTIEFRVKIDFPWSMHDVGDIIKVYKSSCVAYVASTGQEVEKFDLRDFPEIYEPINPPTVDDN